MPEKPSITIQLPQASPGTQIRATNTNTGDVYTFEYRQTGQVERPEPLKQTDEQYDTEDSYDECPSIGDIINKLSGMPRDNRAKFLLNTMTLNRRIILATDKLPKPAEEISVFDNKVKLMHPTVANLIDQLEKLPSGFGISVHACRHLEIRFQQDGIMIVGVDQ